METQQQEQKQQQKQQGTRKKRKNRFSDGDNAYGRAYRSVDFEKRESSGRSGSPHRYFSSSYLASCLPPSNDITKTATAVTAAITPTAQDDSTTASDSLTHQLPSNVNHQSPTTTVSSSSSSSLAQVIHRHANGLCIVTAGETIPSTVQSIEFIVSEAPPSSAAAKRKRQAKLLRGSKGDGGVKGGGNVPSPLAGDDGIVSPNTVIARLHIIDDGGMNTRSIPIYACVWGEVVELNRNLTPQVLQKDPLLDGYLAIILPAGPFPPHPNNNTKTMPYKETSVTPQDT